MGGGDKDTDQEGTFSLLMSKLSRVHTDGYYPPQGDSQSDTLFKFLVVALCLALIVSIFSGLLLAWKTTKDKRLLLLALILGIAVPVALLALK